MPTNSTKSWFLQYTMTNKLEQVATAALSKIPKHRVPEGCNVAILFDPVKREWNSWFHLDANNHMLGFYGQGKTADECVEALLEVNQVDILQAEQQLLGGDMN